MSGKEGDIMSKRFMNPKGKILVPVNLDDGSAGLLKAAAQISKRTGLGVEVIHVSEYWVGRTWPTEMMLGGPMGGLVAAVEDETVGVALERLRELVKANLPGVDAHCEVLLGYPAESVRAHAVTIGAELLILGGAAEEYKFVPRGLSTVLSLMADAPCPVLVLPRGQMGQWDKNPLSAILADDLQPESDNGILIAYELVAALGNTNLTHLHVNQLSKEDLKEALTTAAAAAHTPEGAMDVDTVWAAAMKSIETKLASRAPGRKHLIEARGGTVKTALIQGDPTEAVMTLAAETKADLLIFGRHRTWRRKPFAVGQMPFHSMLKAHRPVLIAEH
jgi:nucleotide-binding universal stress UspA family protein